MGKTHKPATRAKEDSKQGELPLLFEGFFSSDQNESRTLEIFDSLPKYVYARTRLAKDLTPITKTIILRRRDDQGNNEEIQMEVSLAPAFIVSKAGAGQAIYPGAREELVERAIRKLAVQQVSNTGLHTAQGSSTQIIRVTFTLSQLRRELDSQGHGFKLVELKEALEVLNKATISLSCSRDRSLHGINSAVFSNLLYIYEDKDEGGERSRVAVDYHPLATNAIVNLAFYPINYRRVMSLPSPLARWLVTRMSHRFRQASKHSVIDGTNYQISLTTIFAESGVARPERPYDSLRTVRQALAQLVKENVLHELHPYDEEVSYGAPSATGGRRAVTEAVWKLFPSRQFAQEIIEGNIQMKQWRTQFAPAERPEKLGETKRLPFSPR